MEWRRFQLITEDQDQIRKLERLLEEKALTRQELALILFSLRVRPGMTPQDFGMDGLPEKEVSQ